MAETSETIAIIGCGLIGESWSALFTAYGHEVTVWDRASPAWRLSSIDGRGEVGHARD
jgi:3-hydroxyacyl-CoA dehydrogenase